MESPDLMKTILTVLLFISTTTLGIVGWFIKNTYGQVIKSVDEFKKDVKESIDVLQKSVNVIKDAMEERRINETKFEGRVSQTEKDIVELYASMEVVKNKIEEHSTKQVIFASKCKDCNRV